MDLYLNYFFNRLAKRLCRFFPVVLIIIGSCTNSANKGTGQKVTESIAEEYAAVERFMVADKNLGSSYRSPKIDYHKARNNLTVIKLEEAWEKNFNLGGPNGVIVDHEGHLRMYYGIRGLEENEGKGGLALAISKDGGNTWEKPALGNLNKKVLDHEKSNLIDIPYDEDAHVSPEKIGARAIGYHDGLYVMVAGKDNKAYGFTSKDGIHWEKSGYIGNIRTDGAWNIFYDTIEKEWKIYGRIRGQSNWEDIIGYDAYNFEKNPNPTTRRGISLSRSKNFTDSPWEEVSALAIDPQDYWAGWNKPDSMGMPTGITPDFYVGSIYEYFGQYIGFPPTFFMDRDRINPRREKRIDNPNSFDEVEINRRSDGPTFPVMVLSRNGRDFDIPFKNTSAVNEEPYLRVSQEEGTTQDPDKPEVGQLQSTRMVIVGDEIQIYFFHRLNSHYESWGNHERSIERTTIKLDRFASMGANQEWLSEKVRVPEDAKTLRLNSRGVVSVRIRNSAPGEGEVIPGFSYENSNVPVQDGVHNQVRWEDKDFEELQGQLIRIEVLPHRIGRFYGFSFL